EVENEPGDRHVEGAIADREALRVADQELRPPVRKLLTGELDVLIGGIDGHELDRATPLEDDLTQRAGPTPDVEPATARRHREPPDELAGNRAAPAADVGLIRLAARPDLLICGGRQRPSFPWSRPVSAFDVFGGKPRICMAR